MPLSSKKTVLVCGGASGIGKATAFSLSSKGWTVIVADRADEAGNAVVREIAELGGAADFVHFDVTSEESVASAVAGVIVTHGRSDAALNSTGIFPTLGSIDTMKSEEFAEILRVNFLGTFLCLKYEIQHMKGAGRGAIVKGSAAGIKGLVNFGHYAASKAGVISISRTAALENATGGNTINCLYPGPVHTEMVHNSGLPLEAWASLVPSKVIMKPQEVVDAIEFLFNSPNTTGAVISMDGGYSV